MFIFKDTEPSPLQDSFGVRQKGGLPGPPPPVVPHPESLAAQAAYSEALLVTGTHLLSESLKLQNFIGKDPASVCVYYCSTYYKAVRVGGGDSGGHVLRETTSRGLSETVTGPGVVVQNQKRRLGRS